MVNLPESFSVHVLLRDAAVGQSLIPDGVQGVLHNLGLQFIGLGGYRRAYHLSGLMFTCSPG